MLPDRAIAHLAYFSEVAHILRQTSLVEEGEAKVCSEGSKVILHRSELLIGGVRPVVLSTTDTYELIKGLVELCRSIKLFGSLLLLYVARPMAGIEGALNISRAWHNLGHFKALEDLLQLGVVPQECSVDL